MSDEAKFQFYLNRQGVRGKKGEKGDTGFSPTIEVAVNTAAEYKLKVINEGDEFITDNLRGSAVDDMGGTYMRYDPETQKMYAGNANQASEEITGEVALADDSAMQQFDIYTAVTPKKLADNLSFYLKSSDNSVIISQDSEDSKTNLIADLTGVEAEISGLDSRVTGCESAISNLEQVDITLQNNINTVNTDLQNTKLTVASQGDTIANHGGRIQTLEHNQSLDEDAITNNTAAIASLQTGKVDKVAGKGLSTNDFTNEDNEKLMHAVVDSDLANVAFTGDFADLINVPANILTASSVDGTTITYDSTTGKISTVGGGGSSYTSGDGININANNEISVKVDPFSLTFNASNQLTTVGKMFDSYTRTILDPTSQEEYAFTDYKFPVAETSTWTPTSGIIYNLKTRLRDGFNNIILTNDMITQANGIQFTPNGDNGEFTIGAKIDGTTITTNSSGELQATQYTLPTASTTDLGGVKVDGTTITIDSNGVISSSGGSTPTNMVTTNTAQTISGQKTFTSTITTSDSGALIRYGTSSGTEISFDASNTAKNWKLHGTGYTASTMTISGFRTTTINAGNTSSDSKLILSHDSLIFNKSDNTQVDLLASGGAEIDDTQASATTTYSSNMINSQITSATTALANTVQSYYVQKSDIATTLSSSSTDSQVASAKCVYDMIGDIETLLSNI